MAEEAAEASRLLSYE